MVNLWNPAIYSNGLTPEQQNLLNFDMQSTSDRSPNIIVVPVGQEEEKQQNVPVLPQVTPAVNTAADRTYMPLVPSMPQVDRRALADLSYSEPVIEDLQGAPTGEEPLPKTDDPWYGRIAGTVRNILSMSSDFADKLAEKTPTGTVLSDWVNNFAASPFLAMPRNEVFQRMQAQANANLDRQAKYGREGSQAAAMQIYKQFLGELGYDNPNLTPEQRGEIEQTAYEKTLDFLQASRSNINIGGTAKMSEQIAMQTYKDLYDASSDYQELAPRLENTISALESDKFGTGGGDLGAWARDFAANWGILSDEEAANIASFNELNGRLRQSFMKSFKGAISNKEQDLISKALPGLGRSKAANIAMLKLILLQKQLQNESYETYAELTRQYRDPEDVNAAFAEYLKARYAKTVERVNAITGGRSGSDKSWGYKADEGEVMDLE